MRLRQNVRLIQLKLDLLHLDNGSIILGLIFCIVNTITNDLFLIGTGIGVLVELGTLKYHLRKLSHLVFFINGIISCGLICCVARLQGSDFRILCRFSIGSTQYPISWLTYSILYKLLRVEIDNIIVLIVENLSLIQSLLWHGTSIQVSLELLVFLALQTHLRWCLERIHHLGVIILNNYWLELVLLHLLRLVLWYLYRIIISLILVWIQAHKLSLLICFDWIDI